MENVRRVTVTDGDGPGAGDDVLELGGPTKVGAPVVATIGRSRPRGGGDSVALARPSATPSASGTPGNMSRRPCRPAPPRLPRLAVSFSAGGFPLSQSGLECSVQTGRELQVGLEITNLSLATLRLRRIQVVLPLGGLKVTSQAWGPCGQLAAADDASGRILPPTLGRGASSWFTVTFQVLVRCPQPLPVQFALHYDQQGRPAVIQLPGFPDPGPGSLLRMPVIQPALTIFGGWCRSRPGVARGCLSVVASTLPPWPISQ